jgi:hypothetical protein
MPYPRRLDAPQSDWNGEFIENSRAKDAAGEVLTGEVVTSREINPSTNVKRLIVLVPEQVIGEGRLAKRIWMLASARRLNILLVARVTDRAREMSTRRQLASLASSLYDAWYKVDTHVAYENNWVDVLHEVIQLGDMIVCNAEQIEPYGKFRDRSLQLVLSEEFSNPLTVLSGFCEQEKPVALIHWPRQLFAWGGFLLILTVFSLIEFRVDHLVKGTIGTLLLIVILVVEFGLIWFVNAITNG